MEPKADVLPKSSSPSMKASIHTKLRMDAENLIKLAESNPINYSEFRVVLSRFKRHFDSVNDRGKQDKRKQASEMLRESGVFVILVRVLEEAWLAGKTEVLENNVDVELFSMSINVLANFFVFDGPETAKGAGWELNLLEVAERVLLHPILAADSDILHRVLRLITNVLKRHTSNLHSIIGTGLLDGILSAISRVRRLEGTNIWAKTQKILTSFYRCVKICVSDKNVKRRINSKEGITIVMTPLFWDNLPLDDTLTLHMFRIVNELVDDRMSTMTREQVDKLSKDGPRLFHAIIRVFRNSIPNSEMYDVSERILRSLISSKTLIAALADSGIYEAIFYHISQSDTQSVLDRKLQMLRQLLLAGSSIYAPTIVGAPSMKSVITSSLKVLRMKELCCHHVMMWWLYYNLPSESLTSLIHSGLLAEVRKSLHDSCGIVSFDELCRNVDTVFAAEVSSPTCDIEGSPIGSFPKVTKRPEYDYNRSESPVGSPAQSSPTSSGIYSMNEESDEDSYSPIASEEEDTVLPCSSEQFLHNHGDVSSDDGLPRKRMKRDPPPQELTTEMGTKPKSAFQTVYGVSLLGSILNLVKKLLFIPPAKQELSSLLPTFLGIFLEVERLDWKDVTRLTGNFCPTFIVQCDAGQLHSSLLVIMNNLFLDNQRFQEFVTEEVQTLLHKMKFIKTGSGDMSVAVAKLLTALRGNDYAVIRGYNLSQWLNSDTDRLRRIKAAISIPIFLNDSPLSWFKRCSEVLIDALEEESSNPLFLFGHDSVILSLLAMSDNLDVKWSLLRQTMQANQLPTIPDSEFRLPNYPTNTTVAIFSANYSGGSTETVLHLETEFLQESSPVFQVMLESNFREAKERKIRLTGFSACGLRLFFEQVEASKEAQLRRELPTGKNHSLHTLFEILSLAHRYMIPDLYNKTANRILGSELHASTFLRVYKSAQQFPELPCDMTRSDALSIREMTFLYFLKAGDLSIPTKTVIFKELIRDRTPTFFQDLRSIYSTFCPNQRNLR